MAKGSRQSSPHSILAHWTRTGRERAKTHGRSHENLCAGYTVSAQYKWGVGKEESKRKGRVPVALGWTEDAAAHSQ
jgi:hypothetical protein